MALADDESFPRLGISLPGLEQFIAARGRREAFAGLTTAQVCVNYVVPATADTARSYCQQLLDRGSRDVAGATAFVSHAWAYRFLDVVDALSTFEQQQQQQQRQRAATAAQRWDAKARAEAEAGADNREGGGRDDDGDRSSGGGGGGSCGTEDGNDDDERGECSDGARPMRSRNRAFYWFDLFSNSQHNTAKKDFSWWTGVFQTNISEIGRTLLVLRWEQPLPLQRVWCLWEIAASLRGGVQLEVIMCADEAARFGRALVDDFASVARKTCVVDVELAEATQPLDRVRIFDAIRSTVGFQELNKQVIARMREWMGGVGRETLNAMAPEERATSDLTPALASLFLDQGRLEASEQLFRESMEGQLRARGRAHGAFLRSATGLAEVLWTRGRHAEAEPLLRSALPELRAATGPAALRGALRASNLLALILFERGCASEAEPLYRETLAGRRAAFGDLDSDTLISVNNMGFFLRSLSRLEEAEAFYREALAGRRATLGDLHKDTLGSVNGLAVLLHLQGRFCDAEPLFREALAGRQRTLGDEHASTARSVANLGALLCAQGRLAEALPLYRAALDAFRLSLGAAHPDALGAQLNLAALEWELGGGEAAAAATARMQGALEGLSRALGAAHPEAELCRSNLAVMASAAGNGAKQLPGGSASAEATSDGGDDGTESCAAPRLPVQTLRLQQRPPR